MANTDPFIGVQLGSHSVYDEGVDPCLDLLQKEGAINAVFVYTHMHHHGFSTGRVKEALADDHGVAVKDPSTRRLTMVWTQPHDRHYAGTILRNDREPDAEYGDRDILADIMEPARRRGMGVYARILEGHSPSLARLIPNWTKVLGTDVYGKLNHLPCWNNPDYRNYWLSTVEDLFRNYDLDGFKFGAERSGPLSNLLFPGPSIADWDELVPNCFCDHCRAKASARGMDAERARLGMQALFEYMGTIRDRADSPPEGAFIGILRLLLRYPEILAWESFQHASKQEVAKIMYGAIKMIKPSARVGWHVYHRGLTWDPIYRAQTDYAEMARYSDWIKPVVYHDIAGPRVHGALEGMGKGIFKDMDPEQALAFLYAVMGYDAEQEPAWSELQTKGFSPDYVYRETKRAVDGVAGKADIYAGVGFDVPWKRRHFPSDPETTYQATLKAFEAGAAGLVVSREYDEMRLDNLRAVKRAIRDAVG